MSKKQIFMMAVAKENGQKTAENFGNKKHKSSNKAECRQSYTQ